MVNTIGEMDKVGLTKSQLLIWTGQELSPNAPLYNTAFTFEFEGNINVSHFKQAFQRLIGQSDILRTVFLLEQGMPYQKVLPFLEYELQVLDWSDHPDIDLLAWSSERCQIIFDVAKCSFESLLIKRSPNHYIWYLNQHHLNTDAWSVMVLYNKLADNYQRSLAGNLDEATMLPKFRDYIEYENSLNQNQATAFWKDKLTQFSNPPKLYGRKNVGATSQSERTRVQLSTAFSEKLIELTKEKDIRGWTKDLSLFNIFATCLFAYLYRVSGEQKITIGTPSHNRPNPAFRKTAGVFIEFFPFSVEVDPMDSFGSLFQKVKIEANNFLKYAQSGASSPDLSRSFNVVLNYIKIDFPDFNGIPKKTEWLHPGHCDPRHHMRLHVTNFDENRGIQLSFDLNQEVFEQEGQTIVPQHFEAILQAMVNDRSQLIDSVNLISDSERKLLLEDFNGVWEPSQKIPGVLDLFELNVNENPNATALIYSNKSMSYEDLNKRTNQICHFLLKEGIGKGDRIAVFLKRSPHLISTILGILKSGATYVPIATDYPVERIKYMLEDSQSVMVFTEESFANGTSPIRSVPILTEDIQSMPVTDPRIVVDQNVPAYIMYTSGSTGRPKGVVISRNALNYYLYCAKKHYASFDIPKMPLFTSIGFDLTVTTLYLPLITGGTTFIYPEPESGPDLSILNVVKHKEINLLKLTPSHLRLIDGEIPADSGIRGMIVGGEDFKKALAEKVLQSSTEPISIYNEYGPTEATVGCVVYKFNPDDTKELDSVPIGQPFLGVGVYVLNSSLRPVPKGVPGELFIGGKGLADGYWNRLSLTEERFITNPFEEGELIYKTGDLVRLNDFGQLEYLGRIDQQVKLNGRRIELGEIEGAAMTHPDVTNATVVLQNRAQVVKEETIKHCSKCGLPSNYPNVEFDEHDVCNHCRSFDGYQQKIKKYFKSPHDLELIFQKAKEARMQSEYDCMMLLSGGKDSTYALAKLVEMGLRVLTFTLDNGFISEQAKDNIRRVVKTLGVDHVFGTTPAMNAIFVDSLQRHANVCNGCFKTIYTLSMKIALEKKIPFIVTGLSRGQFFETRLTEELFLKDDFDVDAIDKIILDARKAYHRVDDAVKRLLDVSIFDNDEVFEKVRFLDYYRYTDVSLEEMYQYLDQQLPWVRPTDTGRSTNCLINRLGIYVHKNKIGYSNYAFPYSWDVRVGHKTREASLDEINEVIEETEVKGMMEEIGYHWGEEQMAEENQLVLFYESSSNLLPVNLKNYLAQRLPQYMVPAGFTKLQEMPLTSNGKIDRKTLEEWNTSPIKAEQEYVPPGNEIEAMLCEIWSEVLYLKRVGVNDNFLELGGNSLTAIRLMSRVNEILGLDLPVNQIFENPSVGTLSTYIEDQISELLGED